MSHSPKPLWLHIYSGRENGLMVVGNRDSLKSLGNQLVSAAEANDAAQSERWPAVVARPEVVGPYNDTIDFKLSFHLEGTAPPVEVLPLCRRTVSLPVLSGVALLAVVGAVSIARWVLTYVL